MDSSLVTPTIDFSKVEAINQKRTLAFINHWVLHTVAFLNQFSAMCEERLIALETKIRQADHTLAILEAKLNSVPDLRVVMASSAPSNQDTVTNSITSGGGGSAGGSKESEAAPLPSQTTDSSTQPEGQDVVDTVAAAPQPATKPISEDPRFSQYFRMLRMGVPDPAIRMKMSNEGVDPSLLDDPSAPAPPGGPASSGHDSDSDSDSSWSD